MATLAWDDRAAAVEADQGAEAEAKQHRSRHEQTGQPAHRSPIKHKVWLQWCSSWTMTIANSPCRWTLRVMAHFRLAANQQRKANQSGGKGRSALCRQRARLLHLRCTHHWLMGSILCLA